MLDLDKIERIPPYEVKQGGKVHTFDTITLVAALAKDAKDNEGKPENNSPHLVTSRLSKILGLSLVTQDAMEIMKDFGVFADKFDAKLKELFGISTPTPPDTTTPPETPPSPVPTDQAAETMAK